MDTDSAAAATRAAPLLGDRPAAHAAVLAQLDRWVEAGWLRALDVAFADFLARRSPEADPRLVVAAALASHQLGRGHACLDLAALAHDPERALALPPEDVPEVVPEDDRGAAAAPRRAALAAPLADWLQALAHPALVGTGEGSTPLVRDGTRLYLRRFWRYEQAVQAQVLRRVRERPAHAQAGDFDARLRAALDLLFADPAGEAPKPAGMDWQRAACALAARARFAVITGGPGTGKTTTVVRLLALLQVLATGAGDPSAAGAGRRLRIRLAAPTGKAAARLNESIAGAVSRLPLEALGGEALRATIPTEVSTVHRLLGTRPDSRAFRHDADRRLALDLLVVDEASMLDLETMHAVLQALPDEAMLVLLGDKDQLASVDAGAVLGDLCRRADEGHYDEATVAWLEAVTGQQVDPLLRDPAGLPLDQAVVKLRTSYRFDATSGIGRLAQALNRGDLPSVRAALGEAGASGADGLPRLLPLEDERAFAREIGAPGAPPARRAAEPTPLGGTLPLFDDLPPAPSRSASRRALAPEPPPPAPAPQGHRVYLEVLQAQRPPAPAPRAAFDRWALAVLAAQARFQVLCALRRGPQGVEGLNRRIERLLRDEGLIEPAPGGWYEGRPVLVTRNDYGLGLMNGDMGVALALPASAVQAPGASPRAADLLRQPVAEAEAAAPAPILRVAFPAGDGSGRIRWVLPSRLSAVETVYAMTVHKSQGSEFTRVLLVLPEQAGAVLTRELVYTGVTRAREGLAIAAELPVLEAAVGRRVERFGGLRFADPASAAPDRAA